MKDVTLTNSPNRIIIRWLFGIGILMTIANCLLAFFFVREYAGYGLLLMLGVAVPHIALGSAAWGSKSKVGFWIRLSLWIVSNAMLFLPFAITTPHYFTRWMVGQFNAADVGFFATKSYIMTIASKMTFVAIVFFPLWPIAEIMIAMIQAGRTDPEDDETTNKNEIRSIGLGATAFSVFQFLLGFALLAYALGIQMDSDHMPGLLWSAPYQPMFTVACSHLMIGFAILSRDRRGWIALAINAFAWCAVAIFSFSQQTT